MAGVVQGSKVSMPRFDTILLYGDTGDGKTALIGEIAAEEYRKTKRKTRLYSADRGGWVTIEHYVELGVIEAVPLFGDPWIWVNKASKGMMPDAAGKWHDGVREDIAIYAFEGITSLSDAVMNAMAEASGKGVNIGGSGAFNFRVQEGEDTLVIGTNNIGHYAVAQQRVLVEVARSQELPGIVLWTASARRGKDQDTTSSILGPQSAGEKQTGDIPRWFKYTFRVAAIPQVGKEPEHILYIDDHVDQTAAMAKGLGNARLPLAGGENVKIPAVIKPASLVKALDLIKARKAAALEDEKRRLGIA